MKKFFSLIVVLVILFSCSTDKSPVSPVMNTPAESLDFAFQPVTYLNIYFTNQQIVKGPMLVYNWTNQWNLFDPVPEYEMQNFVADTIIISVMDSPGHLFNIPAVINFDLGISTCDSISCYYGVVNVSLIDTNWIVKLEHRIDPNTGNPYDAVWHVYYFAVTNSPVFYGHLSSIQYIQR